MLIPIPMVHLMLFDKSPIPYDLVLLDLKLDSIDGRSIYRKLKERDPSSKICVFTALE